MLVALSAQQSFGRATALQMHEASDVRLGRLPPDFCPTTVHKLHSLRPAQQQQVAGVVPCCSILDRKQHAALACLMSWAGSPRRAPCCMLLLADMQMELVSMWALQQVADAAGDVAGAGAAAGAEGAAQAREGGPGLRLRRPQTVLCRFLLLPSTAGLPGASGRVRPQQRPLRLSRHFLRHLPTPRAGPHVSPPRPPSRLLRSLQGRRTFSASAGAAGSKETLQSLKRAGPAGSRRSPRGEGGLARLPALLAPAGAAVGSPLPVQMLPRRLRSLRCQTPRWRPRVARLRRHLQQAGV